MNPTPLHERLQAAAGDHSFSTLAEKTATHPESVRRYMQGHPPSAEFLAAFCKAFGINGDWVLTGRGPMRSRDIRSNALADAGAKDLLAAVAGSLEQIIERMDRLEFFVQEVDVRIRAQGEGSNHVQAAHERPVRVRLIAEALAQRSRSHDR